MELTGDLRQEEEEEVHWVAGIHHSHLDRDRDRNLVRDTTEKKKSSQGGVDER